MVRHLKDAKLKRVQTSINADTVRNRELSRAEEQLGLAQQLAA